MSTPEENKPAAGSGTLAAAEEGCSRTTPEDSKRPGVQRQHAQRRLRWLPRPGWSAWRARLARLAWPVALIAAAVALYVCYLNVSWTQAVGSDGASNALQAWDMLHGNPLLRGWLLGHVSFYTTELPEYVIVEAIRGLNAGVLHISAAITYTLLVLAAGLLARGRAKGREGVLRALVAAGIMIAPQLGPGVFILVFQPDHVGTQVPLLVTWLVLDRAPRRWYVPVVITVMLAWTEVADSFALLVGAVPLAAVAAMRAYRTLVQRREPLRAAWFDLSLIAAAALSAEAMGITVKLIGAHGGYSVLAVPTGLATAAELPNHLWLFAQGVLGIYGADFLGQPSIGLAAAIAFLHLIGLALACAALWQVLRRFFGRDDLIAQVLAVSIVVTMAAYVVSTIPLTYYSARYLAGVLAGGAVLAGRMLARPMARARLVPAMSAVFACYLAALGYTAAQPAVPAVSQNLAYWLAEHHLGYGLSSYGLANTTTLASGGAVDVLPVTWTGRDVLAGPSGYKQAWYDPLAHDADFVVLLAVPSPLDEIAPWQVRDTFGPPQHSYDYDGYVIMTWDINLLANLSP